MVKSALKKDRVLCRNCKRLTNHEVLFSKDWHSMDGDDSIQLWSSDQVLMCCGCDEISFRHTDQCSEDIDYATGQLIVNEVIYPNRAEGRSAIDGYDEFPPKTRRIYQETLKALNQNAFILAAIGLRAIIESICVEQKTPGRNLEKRIGELADSGLLSKKQAEFLHAHRFIGNAAAHEMVAPKASELIAALDIAETLLKTIYILPDVANQLKPKQRTTAGA